MITKTQLNTRPMSKKETVKAKRKAKNNVNVFFASDRNYLPYLAVALASLSDHATNDNFYNIRILSEDLTNESLHGLNSETTDNTNLGKIPSTYAYPVIAYKNTAFVATKGIAYQRNPNRP